MIMFESLLDLRGFDVYLSKIGSKKNHRLYAVTDHGTNNENKTNIYRTLIFDKIHVADEENGGRQIGILVSDLFMIDWILETFPRYRYVFVYDVDKAVEYKHFTRNRFHIDEYTPQYYLLSDVIKTEDWYFIEDEKYYEEAF